MKPLLVIIIPSPLIFNMSEELDRIKINLLTAIKRIQNLEQEQIEMKKLISVLQKNSKPKVSLSLSFSYLGNDICKNLLSVLILLDTRSFLRWCRTEKYLFLLFVGKLKQLRVESVYATLIGAMTKLGVVDLPLLSLGREYIKNKYTPFWNKEEFANWLLKEPEFFMVFSRNGQWFVTIERPREETQKKERVLVIDSPPLGRKKKKARDERRDEAHHHTTKAIETKYNADHEAKKKLEANQRHEKHC